jgi:phosphoribosylanthranilate isomerase
MVMVKICGLTNVEDALAAVEFGADILGFVFAPSARQVTRETVAGMVERLPAGISTVGVFGDAPLEDVQETMRVCDLSLAQLHGSESPEFCRAVGPQVIKSFRVKDDSVLGIMRQYDVAAFLLDGYDPVLKGGAGRTFDWGIARKAVSGGRVILSGGLTEENVGRAVAFVKPYGVDACSGVEAKPGIKDHARMKAFIRAAKGGP